MGHGRVPGSLGLGTSGAIVTTRVPLGRSHTFCTTKAPGPVGLERPQRASGSTPPAQYVASQLSYEQFRDAVLGQQVAHMEAKGRKHFAPVPEEELDAVEGRYRLRRAVASNCRQLLANARTALAAAKASNDTRARDTTSIGIASAYRDYEYDLRVWEAVCRKYYLAMIASQQFAGREHSSDAQRFVLRSLLPNKAAPGFSNHGNGTAVDFTTTVGGVVCGTDNNPRNHAAWRGSWLHAWLILNAANYRFKPLASEEWHWDYK